MQGGNYPTKRIFEFDYLKGDTLPFNLASVKKLILQPHHESLFHAKKEIETISFGNHTKSVVCTCIKNTARTTISEQLSETSEGLFFIDVGNLPLKCISNILLLWKKKSQSKPNIGLGLIIREDLAILDDKMKFQLFQDGVAMLPEGNKNRDSVWLPSLAISEKILTESGKKLNPYDVYPLVENSDDQFIIKDSGLLDNVEFLEYSRIRTRNLIYLDVSRPDATFSRLSQTINALLKSNFSAYEPVISPGGSANSFISEVCATILNGSVLYMPLDFIPFPDNKKISGFVILRNLL